MTIRHDEAKQAILEYIQEHPGHDGPMIQEALNMKTPLSAEILRDCLSELEEEEKIKFVPAGWFLDINCEDEEED